MKYILNILLLCLVLFAVYNVNKLIFIFSTLFFILSLKYISEGYRKKVLLTERYILVPGNFILSEFRVNVNVNSIKYKKSPIPESSVMNTFWVKFGRGGARMSFCLNKRNIKSISIIDKSIVPDNFEGLNAKGSNKVVKIQLITPIKLDKYSSNIPILTELPPQTLSEVYFSIANPEGFIENVNSI